MFLADSKEHMQRYLSDDHRAFQAEVRGFAVNHIAPVAQTLDREERFPWENVRKMADLGLLGVPVPKDLGGLGRDYLSYILAIEELAKFDASHAITISAHTTLGSSPLVSFGTRDQQERFVPFLASGQVLGGFGLTEPGAGSDSSGSRTRAVPDGDGYRLSGSKIFITHAGVGEIFTVTAVTDPEKGARGISSFVVCKPTTDIDAAKKVGVGHRPDLPYTEGVKAGKKEEKLGWRASDTRELLLEDAWVPREQRLGEEGEGFINFMKTLDAGRVGIAALSLGIAQGALDTAVQFTGSSRNGSGRIWDNQDIQFGLADLATEVEAGRHLTYHAAWLMDQGAPFSREAAMAKLFCSELAMKASDTAIRYMGGYGFTSAYPVERMMRDAKVCEIGEGTNEIQKIIIGRHLLSEHNLA